jgi:hypothetical protein
MDAPGAPPGGPGLLDQRGAGSVAPGPTGRSWRPIEELLAVHSDALTEQAARLAAVEARPDTCPRDHSRVGRCADCRDRTNARYRARRDAARSGP